MAHISRFKLRDDDRTGFTMREVELVKDGPYKVGAEEMDLPPPSRLSLGGEGERSTSGQRDNSDFTASALLASSGKPFTVTYAEAATVLTRPDSQAWLQVSGSNQAVTLTSTPYLTAGRERQVLTIQCVDSGVTLPAATGVTLMGGAFRMQSGSIISFYFNSANAVWQETARSL